MTSISDPASPTTRITPEPAAAATTIAATLATGSELDLAQALAAKLAIVGKDWHRLNRNPQVRAKEQLSVALVYLLQADPNPDEVIPRLQQAIGWLDRSIQAPPCPTHGHGK